VTGTESIYKKTPFRTSDVYIDVIDVIPVEDVKAVKTDVLGERITAKMAEQLGSYIPLVNSSKETV
jgi:hypothetical protein